MRLRVGADAIPISPASPLGIEGTQMATPSLAPQKVPTYTWRQLKGHSRVTLHNSLIGEGILKENALMVVAGPMKSFKSFITASIVLRIISGQGFLFNCFQVEHGRPHGRFPIERECRALYLEQEIGEDDLEDRLAPMVASMNPDEQRRIDDNLITHSVDHYLQLDVEVGTKLIDELVGDFKPNVLVMDPLIEFHSSNENDTQGMSKIMRSLDWIRERHRPIAVILNHHEGHQYQGNKREGLDRLRGSTALGGKCDTGLLLKVHNINALIVRVHLVTRRGKPICPFFVQLHPETLVANFLCWDTPQSRKGKLPKPDSDADTAENFFSGIDTGRTQ